MPILFSFRRCPYAIRARLALAECRIPVTLREVSLKNKPAELLRFSKKGTVPVLVTDLGQVIDESADIMIWALEQTFGQGDSLVEERERIVWPGWVALTMSSSLRLISTNTIALVMKSRENITETRILDGCLLSMIEFPRGSVVDQIP